MPPKGKGGSRGGRGGRGGGKGPQGPPGPASRGQAGVPASPQPRPPNVQNVQDVQTFPELAPARRPGVPPGSGLPAQSARPVEGPSGAPLGAVVPRLGSLAIGTGGPAQASAGLPGRQAGAPAQGPPSSSTSGSGASGAFAAPVASQPSPAADVQTPLVRPPTSSSALVAPSRPGYGTSGNKVTVLANHFAVKFDPNLTVYMYDVAITPELKSKATVRKLYSRFLQKYGNELGGLHPAYDWGKALYVVQRLPFDEKTFVLTFEDVSPSEQGAPEETEGSSASKAKVFKLKLQFVASASAFDLESFLKGRSRQAPQEIIQAFDIALRQKLVTLHLPVGRSFFGAQGATALGGGLLQYPGFFQSLRPTQQGLALNVNTSATAFYEATNVLDFVSQIVRRPLNAQASLNPNESSRVKKAIRKLLVVVTHRQSSRKYRIAGLTEKPTKDLKFSLGEGEAETTMVKYFKVKHKKEIQFKNMPCLVVGSKSNWLPMEFCRIVEGQRFMGTLDEEQRTRMLDATSKPPHLRQADIVNLVQTNAYHSDVCARQFSIVVDPQPKMTAVEGRILTPPLLNYKEGSIQPRDGAWNLRGQKVYRGASLKNWAIISFANPRWVSDQVVQRFQAELARVCAIHGVPVNPRTLVPWKQGRIDSMAADLGRIVSEGAKADPAGLQMLLIILGQKEPSHIYGEMKTICETELNMASQCCISKHVEKANINYLANLVLKINVKLGGCNVLLNQEIMRQLRGVSDRPTILLGADVTHPRPGDFAAPSIAAVVGSVDWPCVSKYHCILRSQKHRQEIVEDMYHEVPAPGGVKPGGIVRELLMKFYQSARQKPQRIIMFRDGVSEGQFSQVLAYELAAIKRACSTLEANYSPPVTFVVVQKRHHTRLFPADPRAADRSGNVVAGTVVDTRVCHPTEFDFYLNSHAGLKGTSRPTHYHVIWDENNFSADGMQKLCNDLCYTYARCTRSVSLVPPAYYADVAATRARHYYQARQASGSDTESMQSGSSAASVVVSPLPGVGERPNSGMFWC